MSTAEILRLDAETL